MSSEFHPDKPEAENELQSRASTRSTVSVAESVAEPAEGWARPTLTAGLDRLIEMIRIPDRLATPASQDANSEEHAQPRGLVLRPALLGFVALLAISIGASMPSSPFKLEMPGTWFFGVPQSGGASTWGVYFVLAAVYGGLLLLMRVWWGMTRLYARRPGIPVRQLMWVFGLWSLPMLVIAPLFSRDVYSYAAQGEMVSHHMNPYLYGPYQLGNNSFTAPVDPLWGNTPAPYGPLFLQIDGFFARITFHNELATIVLLRLLAYAGVLLIAFCIPRLARLYHRDGAELFTLAVLNPVVILHLIGGAHNDALMLGLLLAGITLAKEKRPVLGVILCALATAIKAPAAIGIIYIGWGWLGPSAPNATGSGRSSPRASLGWASWPSSRTPAVSGGDGCRTWPPPVPSVPGWPRPPRWPSWAPTSPISSTWGWVWEGFSRSPGSSGSSSRWWPGSGCCGTATGSGT